MAKIALAVLATATLVFAPSALADVRGMAPFVGGRHAHEEGLDIQRNGHGRETYNDRSTCPNAPMAGRGIAGSTDFKLTSVSGDTATGTITADSNPKNPIGGPVTIKLVGAGQGLELTIAGGDQGFPFCNDNDNDAASLYYWGRDEATSRGCAETAVLAAPQPGVTDARPHRTPSLPSVQMVNEEFSRRSTSSTRPIGMNELLQVPVPVSLCAASRLISMPRAPPSL
jgi:hypothetical protein